MGMRLQIGQIRFLKIGQLVKGWSGICTVYVATCLWNMLTYSIHSIVIKLISNIVNISCKLLLQDLEH